MGLKCELLPKGKYCKNLSIKTINFGSFCHYIKKIINLN